MDERIEKTLQEMARANQIEVEKVIPERGILFGRSVPFNASAIIFISAKHGMQVWYEHEGDCGACKDIHNVLNCCGTFWFTIVILSICVY